MRFFLCPVVIDTERYSGDKAGVSTDNEVYKFSLLEEVIMIRTKGCIPIKKEVVEPLALLVVKYSDIISPPSPDSLEYSYNYAVAENMHNVDEHTDAIILKLNETIDFYRVRKEYYRADTYEVVRRRLLNLPPMKKPKLFSKHWFSKLRYDREENKPMKYVCRK